MIDAIAHLSDLHHTAPAIAEAARHAIDVSINVLKAGGVFTAFVYRPDRSLLVKSPPTDDVQGSIELARHMVSTGSLVLTPELNRTWGNA